MDNTLITNAIEPVLKILKYKNSTYISVLAVAWFKPFKEPSAPKSFSASWQVI